MSAVGVQEHLLVEELTDLARVHEESQVFVSLLAHELRTRLKVTECALASAGGESLELARENTRAVRELAETLLDLARGLPEAPVDANVAAATVLGELRDEVERLEVEIVLGELPSVPLQRGLLDSVLRNLLANALEAGASRVEIFARADGAICVQDDGPGVSPRNAVRIFGVYSSKFGGAGLGLTLCRQILRQRGGDLWVKLPSTFCFRIR
jgi:signal transduction histidine kinase